MLGRSRASFFYTIIFPLLVIGETSGDGRHISNLRGPSDAIQTSNRHELPKGAAFFQIHTEENERYSAYF